MANALGIDSLPAGISENALALALIKLAGKLKDTDQNVLLKQITTAFSNETTVFVTAQIDTDLVKVDHQVVNTKEVLTKLTHTHEIFAIIEDIIDSEITLQSIFSLFATVFILDYLEIMYVQIAPIMISSGVQKSETGTYLLPSLEIQHILEKSQLIVKSTNALQEQKPAAIALLGALSMKYPPADTVVWQQHASIIAEDKAEVLRVKFGIMQSTTSGIDLLETHLDDVSGEILGDTYEVLFTNGALDIIFYPILMKKNRPGYALRVTCKRSDSNKLAELIMKYTGTLGVRVNPVSRHIGYRKVDTVMVDIAGQTFSVSKKSNKYGYKYEFEDIRKIARILGKSPLEILKLLKEVSE